MRVLSSKRFLIPKTSTVSWDYVKEWYEGVDRGLDDCTLVVTLQAMDGKRQQKMTAVRQLQELIVDNIVEDNSAVWKRFEYNFCFMTRKYFWDGKEIHITANEALFLYRWLVLHDDIYKTQMYYLRNMRKRLGNKFLAEETDMRQSV
jgi:hypothetical protein